MIDKDSLNKSIKFFEDIELNNEEFTIIFEKFKTLLNNGKIKDMIINKMTFLKDFKESDDLKKIMHELINKAQIEDLNILLEKLLQEESLTNWLQDFFLEKLI
ncbi:MAG: hypothetical protein BAJALOKI1v1_520015 [Promethearchaeota archaeon]|nr:MAG: hypothetical protein BAJALOKI1v1_520015 [Candidatus Lokiarchaeota archaeon]